MRFKKLRTVQEILAERKTLLDSIKDPKLWVKELSNSELTEEVHQLEEHPRSSQKIQDLVLWYDTRYILSSTQRNMLEQFLLEVKFNIK